MTQSLPRARRFQFTLNEFEKYPALVDAIKSKTNFRAMISCKETAPSTGHVHAHIVTSSSAMIRVMMYIMYIPEDVYVASASEDEAVRAQADYASLRNIVEKHPEWILAWRQFSSDFLNSNTNLDRVSFSSRLKRNLNSGDQICAVVLANVDTNIVVGTPISRVIINGTCQFWTCNN